MIKTRAWSIPVECYPKQSSKNSWLRRYSQNSRLAQFGPIIEDRFASIRKSYQVPKHPIVLTHGLLGFDQLRPGGKWLPGIQYWRGIEEAMIAGGAKVVVAAVPPAGSIEERAEALDSAIATKVPGERVNVIAHSMGYANFFHLFPSISNLTCPAVASTRATPHKGSSLADDILEDIGTGNVARLKKVLTAMSIPSGAFEQLTRSYITSQFNPATRDDPKVRYYSYGACFEPAWASVFKHSHDVIQRFEGPNDGLVSVASSAWGTYQGTLVDVSHLDLINWTNRLRWWIRESMLGKRRTFNAVAFYMDIADMLAKEGF